MGELLNKTLGQIVADNFKAHEVLEAENIDFFNKGKQTLAEAAAEKNLDAAALEEKISQVSTDPEQDFNSWKLDALANHIIQNYHRKADADIQTARKGIEQALASQSSAELEEVKNLFGTASGQIAMHQKREELMLFPMIRKMVDAQDNNKEFVRPNASKNTDPTAMFIHEHDQQGQAFRKIAELTGEFTAPENADENYKQTLALLQQMEKDLHEHIHLENNILFPKAVALMKELSEA